MGREKKSLGKLEATKSAGWVFPNGGFNSVDGSEILRSPVEGTAVYPINYRGFGIHPNGGCLGFLNHQQ